MVTTENEAIKEFQMAEREKQQPARDLDLDEDPEPDPQLGTQQQAIPQQSAAKSNDEQHANCREEAVPQPPAADPSTEYMELLLNPATPLQTRKHLLRR